VLGHIFRFIHENLHFVFGKQKQGVNDITISFFKNRRTFEQLIRSFSGLSVKRKYLKEYFMYKLMRRKRGREKAQSNRACNIFKSAVLGFL
jgi:hypothetical protein